MSLLQGGSPFDSPWFRVAVQALILLAQREGLSRSAYLSESLQTHAVFTRRVLSHLVRAGIVVAREGRDGGYRLACPPERITLGEVYRAVACAEKLGSDDLEDKEQCALAHSLHPVCQEVEAEIEDSLLYALDRHTIASLCQRTAEQPCRAKAAVS